MGAALGSQLLSLELNIFVSPEEDLGLLVLPAVLSVFHLEALSCWQLLFSLPRLGEGKELLDNAQGLWADMGCCFQQWF